MYLFPFEHIAKWERIIIYGAGMVGQSFWCQIKRTNYCEVVAFADRAADKYTGFTVPIVPVSRLSDLKYDKLLIAIAQRDIAEKIAETLSLEYPSVKGKIILGCDRQYDETMQEKTSVLPQADYAYRQECVSIAVYMKRGMGDCIFVRRFIEAFIGMATTPIQLDLFVSPETEQHIHLIMGDMEGGNPVKNIFVGYSLYRSAAINYDLALEIGIFLDLTHCNIHNIMSKDSNFALVVEKLEKKIKSNDLNLRKPSDYYVYIKRCELKGQNCYTSYSYDGLIPINDWHTKIPLRQEFAKLYRDLSFPEKYITLNYSWNKNSEILPKYWPFNYYNELVKMLKNQYSDYEIVQIGMDGADKIVGVDRYLLGKDMELIKYVLQGVALHIDYEGGPVHLATQLGAKCVVLFGPSPNDFYKYEENINVSAFGCSDCMYIDENYTKCYRRLSRPECMYNITPDRVMMAINTSFC